MAAKKMNVPVIVHTFHGHVFHSYFGKSKTLFYKNIERYLAKKTDKIIAISELQKKELVERHKICRSEKTTVISLGFDLFRFQENVEEKRKSFRAKYKINDDEIAVGIIGRLVAIKNHAMFLKVVTHIKEKTSKKVRYFVIGDGEEKNKMKEQCNLLNLDFVEWADQPQKATITFTSWIKEIDWANAGLDIITLTSLNEGTPVSLIEAQASNKPIVTTNVGGVKNITIENKTALISQVNDVVDYSNKLIQLIENDQLRHQMGEQGWEFVKERFSYDRLVEDMKSLYINLLNSK